MREIWYIALFAAALLGVSAAHAQQQPGPCPGSECVTGSQEFLDWWCGSFKDKSSCEWKDVVNKVDCQWAVDKCVPVSK